PSALAQSALYDAAFTPATRWVDTVDQFFNRTAVSPDGNRALALRDDKSMMIYLDLSTGQTVSQWKPTFLDNKFVCGDGLTFAPNGKTAYVDMVEQDFSTGAVIEFDVTTGHEVRRFTPPSGVPCDTSLSPDTQTLFTPTLVLQPDTNILPG